jgi:hypothetical protein
MRILALSVSSFLALPLAAQITIKSTNRISTDLPRNPMGEPYLATDPTNPNNLLASTLAVFSEGLRSVLYRSNDGGKTWTRVKFPGAEVNRGGDPIVYFDGQGVAYFASNTSTGLIITTSRDGGRTWTAEKAWQAGRHLDRQYLTFDRTGRYRGRAYAAAYVQLYDLASQGRSGLAISISDDRTRSWGQAYLVGDMREDEHIEEFVQTLVSSDGTLIFPFLTNREPRGDEATTKYWRALVSKDGGKSFQVGERSFGFETPTGRQRSERAERAVAPGSAAIDRSNGPHRGRVYVTTTAMLNGRTDRMDLFVSYSDDNGMTWSDPVIVNDNQNPADHVNPAITVNKDGVVAVTWNDRRAHARSCLDVYASASLDGGATWLPNAKLSSKPTCPVDRGNWLVVSMMADYPKTNAEPFGLHEDVQGLNVYMISTRFPNGGDTQGLDADSRGVFHAAWIDGSSGTMQLTHTAFSVPGPAAPSKSAIATANDAPTSSDTSRNVSAWVKIVADKCGFNFNAKTFSCTVHLTNKSGFPVQGPFEIEEVLSRWNFPGARYTAADNGQTSVQSGARWNFDLPKGQTRLLPKAKTNSRIITWQFDGFPEEPSYPFTMFVVRRRGS